MRPWTTVLRGCVLAVLSALLTATGHVAGGGSVPELAPLVVLLPLLTGVIAELAGRCTSVLSTVAVLGAGQVVLHELLVVLTPGHHPAAPLSFDSRLMLAGHAVATLMLAALVRHIDGAIMAVAAALGRVVAQLLLPLASDRTPHVQVVPVADPGAAARVLVRSAPRRGPPESGDIP